MPRKVPARSTAAGGLRRLRGVFCMGTGQERTFVVLDWLGKLNRLKVSRDWLVPVGK